MRLHHTGQIPAGTRVKLLPSKVNENLKRATGIDLTGRTGVVLDWALYYRVQLDEPIGFGYKGLPDDCVCLLLDEFEILDA